MICRVFKHSPVFRTGGDEFAVILQKEDFDNLKELVSIFEKKITDICAVKEAKWEKIRVSMGIAVFDPRIDRSVDDVVRRADKLMYDNKREHKSARGGSRTRSTKH